jgi:hypothetical protein
LTRIYYGKNHPGRIHGVNRETGLTYCGVEPGRELFEGDPRGIGCERCWSEARRALTPGKRLIAEGVAVSETRLPAPVGVALFAAELPLGVAGAEKPKRPRVKLPACARCEDLGLEPDRLPAPGGRWRCGRGHGLMEGSEG